MRVHVGWKARRLDYKGHISIMSCIFVLLSEERISNIILISPNISKALSPSHISSLFLQDDYHHSNRSTSLWIDMPWYLRSVHVLKQIPCYLLLFLYPIFSQCCPWSKPVRDKASLYNVQVIKDGHSSAEHGAVNHEEVLRTMQKEFLGAEEEKGGS